MSLVDDLRAALATAGPGPLLTGDVPEDVVTTTTPAAVLVAVTDQPAPGLILTVRRNDMRTHAGQVAFAGGRIDARESAIDAALREAREELDLDPASVAIAGAIEPYHTITGFLVTPVVGVIPPNPRIVPQAGEVADWFEAPLDFVLDPANQHRRSAIFAGRERHYYEILWNERRIWGATAAMIVNLSRRLR